MTGHFIEALNFVLAHEGVYSHDPDDPGGETFRGISRKAHPDWIGWPKVDALTDKRREYPTLLQLDVHAFYRSNYWDKVGGGQLPPRLALVVFDWAVHSGVPKALTKLQILVGFTGDDVDGKFGERTRQAAWDYGDKLTATALHRERLMFIQRLVASNPNLDKFRAGWLNRLDDLSRQIV